MDPRSLLPALPRPGIRPVPGRALPPIFTLLALLASAAFHHAQAAARPNVVFLVSEDNSIHYLRMYGPELGVTPNIERMAAEGLTFNNAYSCAPVCSVARSTLATGLYAPRAGFQYHRKSAPAHLPPDLEPWSATLRKAGYYTSNRSKTDYNFVHDLKSLWDDSSARASWRNRPGPDTPFFHMESWNLSHESSLHFARNLMDTESTLTPPDQVALAPYHPDTPTFRYTHARYFDRIRLIDAEVGRVLAALKADGLLEDTFVFYFGDHGGVLPRGKGYAYDSGLHVPLVVRIPANFRPLAPSAPGARLDGFVEFVDFGPTVLRLAGLPVPSLMDGRPFLGSGVSAEELNARDEAFGYADRMDEKFDFVRTLRKGRHVYIRNFTRFYPDGLQNNYRYKMLAYAEWRELFLAGKLGPLHAAFFQSRPPEQLFDLESDPHQVRNLAGDPAHRATLERMRRRFDERQRALPDLSFLPEHEMVRAALSDPIAYGQQHAARLHRLADIADFQRQPFDQARPGLEQALTASDPWERYWGCLAAASLLPASLPLADQVVALAEDPVPMVRVRAAEFLGTAGLGDSMAVLYRVLAEVNTEPEAMMALQSVVYLRDHRGVPFDLERLRPRFNGGETVRRVEYLSGR